MQIIPAIDIVSGQCVRLTQGDFARQKRYNRSPVDVARSFEAAGLERLHLVDLDGAKDGRVKNARVLEEIAQATGLRIDFGGGVKSDADLQTVFDAGASWASVGSVAIQQEELLDRWLLKHGPDRFLLGADVRQRRVAVSGWIETTSWEILDFIEKYRTKGMAAIFCTDIDKDGLLGGPSLTLYRDILDRFPGLPLLASGGIRSLEDLSDLQQLGCTGAIIGKAIYEGQITLDQLSEFQ
jgi:phosphoribosylformimino-5-aminoimidazole carboxamide ribotide isomerase